MTSCQHIPFLKSRDHIKEAKSDSHHIDGILLDPLESELKEASSTNNFELKQAQIWSKLEYMEKLVQGNKEKIKILEKGLMLGIHIPHDHKSKPMENKSLLDESNMVKKKVTPINVKKASTVNNKASTSISDNHNEMISENFASRMILAKNLFKEGKYGKAFIEFSKLHKEHTDQIKKGEPQYWLGRCWYKLKEFTQAKKYFTNFIDENPNSPWIPSASFHLAKTELDLGLRKAAISRLRALIEKHPYNGSSEAAKQILINIDQTI